MYSVLKINIIQRINLLKEKRFSALKLLGNQIFGLFFLLCSLGFISLSSTSLYAQAQEEQLSPFQSADLRIANLEQSYDSQIIEILSNYFDRRKFFVDVDINAEMIDQTYETTTQNQVVTQRPQSIMMPGLPFLPQENLQTNDAVTGTPETVVSTNTVLTLRLINLTVNIFADSSLSNQEIDFMRLIAGIALKTNTARGDVINITQIAMPNFVIQPDLNPSGTTSAQSNNSSDSDFTSLLGIAKEFVPGILLLVLLGLIVLFNRFLNKPKQAPAPISQQRETFKNEVERIETPAPSQQVSISLTDKDETVFSFEEIGEKFFNDPQEIALLFEYWIDEDPENGAIKAAEVISTVDKRLLRSLKNNLLSERYDEIAAAIEVLPEMSEEKKLDVAKKFSAMLPKGDSELSFSQRHGQQALFKFLDHISDQQLVRLINEEDGQTAALIIDYLPEEKGAQLLDEFDKDKATDIMLNMTTLHSLSYKKHGEIASELFDKAMDVIDKEKDERHGIENILPILEKLPLSEQRDYIDELIASRSVVGEIIDNQFITVEQIPDLKNHVIRDAVKVLNTETMLNALIGLDQRVVDTILSFRPKREQKLLRQELEQTKDKDEKGKHPAKYLLMDSIRRIDKLYSEIEA